MLILASASPRRREILTTLGIPHRIEAADIDESTREGESPHDYVARLAAGKASVVAARTSSSDFVLAADTTVVLDGVILGKPESDADAKQMLRGLMGRAHEVLTGIAVLRGQSEQTSIGEAPRVQVVRTEVHFVAANDASIDHYVACGEGRDKAGSYGAQGRAMGFISSLNGSLSNVIGLPAAETIALLVEAGVIASWPLPTPLAETL